MFGTSFDDDAKEAAAYGCGLYLGALLLFLMMVSCIIFTVAKTLQLAGVL